MRLSQLDLNLLLALRALLVEKNVTRAGIAVGLSQPAMSAALSRLRDLFADELLLRIGRGYKLTPRAERLLGQVEEVLSRVEQMISAETFDPARDARAFTIVTADYATLLLLEPLLERVEPLAPAVSFWFVPPSEDMMEGVQSGKIDLVLAPFDSVPQLESEVLIRDRWVCALAADHPTIKGGRVGRRQYEQLPHVMVAYGPGEAMSPADEEVERLGIQRRVVATTPSFLLLPFLLRGTSLVTLLQHRLAERFREEAGLQLCKPPFPLPRIDLRMIWSPALTSDPAHSWLRETLREAASHSRF